MRKIAKNRLLDKLHKGIVLSCVGVTLAGTALLGYRVYRYFTVIKPARMEQELKMIEEGSFDKAKELPA